MTKEIPDQRPNCEEILNEKSFWALSENEFEFENESKVILESFKEKNQEFSVYSILKSKLECYLELKERDEKEFQKFSKNLSDILENGFVKPFREEENFNRENNLNLNILQKFCGNSLGENSSQESDRNSS